MTVSARGSIRRGRALVTAGLIAVVSAALVLYAPTRYAAAQDGIDPSIIEGKDVSITMWQHSYPPLNDWTQAHIATFMEANPNITVNYELVPFEEWNQKIFTALAGGQAPHVFEADDYTFPQFIADGVISPIQPSLLGFGSLDEMREAWEGDSLALLIDDEVLYGIPYDWEAPVVGYNPALWEPAGLDPEAPATWTEMMEAASQISESDDAGNLINSGFAFVHNIDVYYQIQGSQLFEQAGAAVLNEDQTAAAINSPEAQQVFELWRDAVHEYKVTKPGFTSTFYAVDEFGENRVGSGYMLVWANSIVAPAGFVYGENFGIRRLPTFDNGNSRTRSYAWNWTLNARNTPEETVAAHMLLDHLSQQGDTFLTQAGLINPRKGWRDRLTEEQLAPYAEITESLLDSVPVEPHPKFNEIWAPVISVFKAVELDANADIPALLAGAEAEINEILASG
jgi:ABC-type glycerol-3-phosphate transport system substrate-binding protein